jgi:hypothetical protein
MTWTRTEATVGTAGATRGAETENSATKLPDVPRAAT